MKFSERLRELRTEKGISQGEFARLLDVKQGTVSGWEIGRREPSLEMVRKIAIVLKCDSNYLLGITDLFQ